MGGVVSCLGLVWDVGGQGELWLLRRACCWGVLLSCCVLWVSYGFSSGKVILRLIGLGSEV